MSPFAALIPPVTLRVRKVRSKKIQMKRTGILRVGEQRDWRRKFQVEVRSAAKRCNQTKRYD